MGHSGESHHWTGATARVVVDLGYGPSGRAAAAFRPDVLVLTHSDLDHIGGADAFFDRLGWHPRGEIWMPYEWAVLIDSAARVSDGRAPGLQRPVDEDALETVMSAARVVDAAADRDDRDETMTDAAGRGIRFDEGSLRHAVEHAVFDPAYLEEESWASEEGFLRKALAEGDLGKVASDIHDKAARLAGIVSDALHAGMALRWFSVDHPAPGGAEKWTVSGRVGAVSLVNAVQVEVGHAAPGRETARLFATMRYSIQNRRALATLLWETPTAPHFVVWSDGDGSGCALAALPWDRIGGMTAPHHGSEKNVHDPIWLAAAPHLARMHVVLAGGASNQSLHRTFSAHPPGARGCTSCGRCREEQAGSRPKKHPAVEAEVTWPPLARTCVTGCVCADHT